MVTCIVSSARMTQDAHLIPLRESLLTRRIILGRRLGRCAGGGPRCGKRTTSSWVAGLLVVLILVLVGFLRIRRGDSRGTHTEPISVRRLQRHPELLSGL